MSNISMVEAKLPPGFRFHPRDDELISDYLMNKVTTTNHHHHHHHHHHHQLFDSPLLIEVDLNKCEPWDLPELACVGGKDWYFYSQRDRKYATGQRTNRATATGYWKATGKDRPIRRRDILVGMRKTLVFYRGRAPAGTKTDWVMHEFRLQQPNNFGDLKVSSTKEDWVLCRVFYKNKDAPSKPAMESCYDDHDTTMSSLSLPPLTHSYINFKNNQTGPNNNNNIINGDYDGQQEQVQVPCFSIFNYNQNNQTGPSNIFSSHDQFMNTTTMASDHVSFGGGGPMVEMSGGASNLDPFARDKRVIKAVLDKYFIKMESGNNIGGAMKLGSPTSFGGDGSSERFLSEMGMPNLY